MIIQTNFCLGAITADPSPMFSSMTFEKKNPDYATAFREISLFFLSFFGAFGVIKHSLQKHSKYIRLSHWLLASRCQWKIAQEEMPLCKYLKQCGTKPISIPLTQGAVSQTMLA
jgi:hypothetical protein